MKNIIAGDIGAPVLQKSYASADYAGLGDMLDEFLRERMGLHATRRR